MLLAVGSVSHATIITYDFTNTSALGTGSLGNSVDLTVDSLTAQISGIGGQVHRNNNRGLGVSGSPAGNRVGVGEALSFDFSPISVVAISSLLFERGNGAGQIDVWIDGAFSDSILWTAGGGSSTFTYLFAGNPLGSVFEFRGMADDFRIQEFSVATVSEPGMLALMGVGLLSIGAAARRKRRLHSA